MNYYINGPMFTDGEIMMRLNYHSRSRSRCLGLKYGTYCGDSFPTAKECNVISEYRDSAECHLDTVYVIMTH